MNIILITGATSGIGRHTALHLARRGHRVFATGRREDALAELKIEAGDAPLDVLRLDVTDDASIQAAVREIHRQTDGHGVDVLINNAGYGQGGPVLEIDDAALRRQYDTNVFGLISVTRAFAAAMITRGSGRILNISSIGGRMTFPLLGVYNSTKYAVESLSDALRMELAPLGVDVVLIEPGAINTSFNATVASSVDSQEQLKRGPWAAITTEVDALIGRFEATAPGPQPVADAITRAIEARRPRARYIAPFKDSLLLRFVTLMPTPITDWVMSRVFSLHLAGVEPAPIAAEAV